MTRTPSMTNYEFGDVVLVAFPGRGRPCGNDVRPSSCWISEMPISCWRPSPGERAGPGDAPLHTWAASGLLRASWVRLAKIACLAKGDITRHLGHLHDDDIQRLVALWQALYTFSPRS